MLVSSQFFCENVQTYYNFQYAMNFEVVRLALMGDDCTVSVLRDKVQRTRVKCYTWGHAP